VKACYYDLTCHVRALIMALKIPINLRLGLRHLLRMHTIPHTFIYTHIKESGITCTLTKYHYGDRIRGAVCAINASCMGKRTKFGRVNKSRVHNEDISDFQFFYNDLFHDGRRNVWLFRQKKKTVAIITYRTLNTSTAGAIMRTTIVLSLLRSYRAY